MSKQKLAGFRVLALVFYVVSSLLIALFFILGTTGRQSGTDWRGELFIYAAGLLYLGLLNDALCAVAERLNHAMDVQKQILEELRRTN